MESRTLRRPMLALVAIAAGLAVWVVLFSTADAGHVKGTNGSCTTGPVICRNMWQGANSQLYVRLIDQYSVYAPHWQFAAWGAANSWYYSPGPTRVSFNSQHSSETWIYVKWGETGYGGLDADDLATNWNCFPSCYNEADRSGVIIWSEFYVNSSIPVMQSNGVPYVWQKVIAHEVGHGLGLKHHQNDQHVMRSGYTTTDGSHPNGPTHGDLGNQASPPCSSSTSSRGIRCIYRWTVN